MTAQPARNLVGVKEVARHMRRSVAHVYRLIRTGEIAAYKDGRRTLVDLNTVGKYDDTLPPVPPPVPRRRTP